jgi:ankyrin repeat protein
MNQEKEIYNVITYGTLEELKPLLKDFDVNKPVKEGYAIHYAAFQNKTDIIRYLIDKGANVNAEFEDGATPLIAAAEYGYFETCSLLLEHNADVNKVDHHGNDALVKAVLKGRLNIVELLLENGADKENKLVKGKNALDLAKEMNWADALKLFDKKNK